MQHYLSIGRYTAKTDWPDNYHLTLSGDRNNEGEARKILHEGGNIALAFWPELPRKWWGFPVIDGDMHDFVTREAVSPVFEPKAPVESTSPVLPSTPARGAATTRTMNSV